MRSYTKIKPENTLGSYGHSIRGMFDIELTERCSNNCVHCCVNIPMNDQLAMRKELTTEEFTDILKQIASLNYMTVRFTGGEPLLRRDFVQLYLTARRMGLRVVLFTNATLITQEIANLFSTIPLLELIEITVYGMKEESYENISRVHGSYKLAWRGIKLLLERNVPFVVKGVLLRCNVDEIDGFMTWAASLPWMNRPPILATDLDLRCRRDDAEKNALIRKLRLSTEEVLPVLLRYHKRYIDERRAFASRFMRPRGDRLFACGPAGCVDPYGYFYPCLALRAPETAYNLKQGTLVDALTKFMPYIMSLRATNPEYLRRCARCFLKGLCEQCPPKSYAESGTLDTPVEYLCENAHAEARFLGLLEAGEKGWEVHDWEQRLRAFSGQRLRAEGKLT